MRRFVSAARTVLVLLLLSGPVTLSLFSLGLTETEESSGRRIVTLGSAITEIVFALGHGEEVVAVDASSLYPPDELAGVPRTGYVRALSVEGLLSMEPDLILASEEAGPPEVIDQLRDIAVRLVLVPEGDSPEGVRTRIRVVAEALGNAPAGEELIADIDARLAALPSGGRDSADAISVAFVYARGAGALLVSGTGTSAHAIMELAGGRNAVDEYAGYRPLTPEALVSVDPQVLLFTTSGLESLGGIEGLGQIPGVAETTAYRNRAVIDFDDLFLLGFGPRYVDAALALSEALKDAADAGDD